MNHGACQQRMKALASGQTFCYSYSSERVIANCQHIFAFSYTLMQNQSKPMYRLMVLKQ